MGAEIRKLVQQMAIANPPWRAPRVDGELKMLAVELSDQSWPVDCITIIGWKRRTFPH